jgi:exosome complex exonuclease RRP6
MLYYARSDTHYLLFVYDNLRNLLIQGAATTEDLQNPLESVLERSKELSLSRYTLPEYDPETGDGARGWYNALLRSPSRLSGEQFAVFRSIWKWRDGMARREDENPNFILPVAAITQIANSLPPDPKALHSQLDRNHYVARKNLDDLWAIIQEARVLGVSGPTYLEFLSRASTLPAKNTNKAARALDHLMQPEAGAKVETRQLAKTQLFGDMEMSTVWEESKVPKREENLVMLPWQRLVDNIAISTAGPAAADQTTEDAQESAIPDPGYNGSERLGHAGDDEFTLRAGLKRKSPDVAETSSSEGSDSEPGADVQEEEEAESEIMFAEDGPKRKDRGKKHSGTGNGNASSKGKPGKNNRGPRGGGNSSRDPTETQVPFDYSNATSVLHANRGATASSGGKKKAFNPYGKLEEDGPRGARRAPQPNGSMSATFKK